MLNQDGTLNSADNAARAGSFVSVFATGLGQTDPEGSDGAIAAGAGKPPVRPVTIKVGHETARVTYAGAAPGLVEGVIQINFEVPVSCVNSASLEISMGTTQGKETTGFYCTQ